MFLLVTLEQFEQLKTINSSHHDRRITPRKSNNGNWIVKDDLLEDCDDENSTWYDWKDWLHSLASTDDTPAPKPQRPAPKPKNP